MLDEKIIRAIEKALENDKRVEVGKEYSDRQNKKDPRIVVVEITRKVNTMCEAKD